MALYNGIKTYQASEEPEYTREKDSLTNSTIKRFHDGIHDGVDMQQRHEELGLICLSLEKRCLCKTQNRKRCANFERILASKLFGKTLKSKLLGIREEMVCLGTHLMERNQPSLRSCVICNPWRRDISTHRGNVENVAVVVLDHGWKELFRE